MPWLILSLVCLLQSSAESLAAKRRAWWRHALKKRAPVLECGDGSNRGGMMYGAGSNYGAALKPLMSGCEFYINFRFAPCDIPRLVKALHIPAFFVTRSRCRLSGEEALLMFLKRMSYPDRLRNLIRFFNRSYGYISEMVEAVRKHLHGIARKLLLRFDWRRLVPLRDMFARMIHAKGHPLKIVALLLDGKFQACCRPYDAIFGYRSLRQRAFYNGAKKLHGYQNQGVGSPEGIVVEMHGPFQGRIHDSKMLTQSRLLIRMKRFFGLAVCLFADRGYSHGDPSLQVPFQGAAGRVEPGRSYNIACSAMRQPIEWMFGKVVILFAFVDFKKNQKLYLQPVTSYFLIATLLTNCHSCLYGNQTSQYFQVPTPDLEDYLLTAFL